MHVYACVRHPQYAGLFRVTIAMLVQWPTIIAGTLMEHERVEDIVPRLLGMTKSGDLT